MRDFEKMKADNIEVNIMVNLSLWNALKSRLAGIANVMEKGRQQETGKPLKLDGIRINKNTGKPEICVFMEFSTTKPYRIIDEKWVDYEINLLTHTFGMCPGGGEIYPLIRFRQKAIEEAKKIKEGEMAEKARTKEDTHGGVNYNHGHDTKVLDEAQNSIDARVKEAEEAGLDPALLF